MRTDDAPERETKADRIGLNVTEGAVTPVNDLTFA